MAILRFSPQCVDQLERLAVEITGKQWIGKSLRRVAVTNRHMEIATKSGIVFKRGTSYGDRVTASRQASAYLLKIIDLHDKATGQNLGDQHLRAVAEDIRLALMVNQDSGLIEEARQHAASDYTKWTKLVAEDTDQNTTWYACGCAVCPEHNGNAAAA